MLTKADGTNSPFCLANGPCLMMRIFHLYEPVDVWSTVSGLSPDRSFCPRSPPSPGYLFYFSRVCVTRVCAARPGCLVVSTYTAPESFPAALMAARVAAYGGVDGHGGREDAIKRCVIYL